MTGSDDQRSTVTRCLDPERVSKELSETLPMPQSWRLARVGVARFWPHKRDRFTIEYRITLQSDDGSSRDVLLQGRYRHPISANDLRYYEKPADDVRLTDKGLMGVRCVAPGLSMVVHSPDCDRRMRWLRSALSPRRFAAEIAQTRTAECLGVDAMGDGLRCTIAGYRAGRRCAVRYDAQRTVYGKVFRDDRGAALAARHEALADFFVSACGSELATPRSLDYVDAMKMVVFEAAPAEASSVAAPSSAERAGMTLAVLHGAPLAVDARCGVGDELATLDRWRETLDVLGTPDVDRFRDAANRLGRAWPTEEPCASRLLHRDFHEAQLLISATSVTLVDLDTLTRGDPEVDLATYLAHRFLSVGTEPGASQRFAAEGARFLDGYADHGGAFDAARLGCYLASAMLRLGAIQLFRRPRAEGADPLWAGAGALVARVGKRGADDPLDTVTGVLP